MNPEVEYKWERPDITSHNYIVPEILSIIKALNLPDNAQILDAGCGGGSLVNTLYKMCFKNVYGFDASKSGIEIAKKNFPELVNNFFSHDAYESKLPPEVPQKYDLIISMEVIEHMYSPKTYLENISSWMKDNGYLILTTPYHGYLKNLLIAILNKFDKHFNPLWEGGHIKFFSRKTLYILLKDSNIKPIKFYGVGRISYLWKSMIILGTK